MEFHLYAITGAKRILEDLSTMESKEGNLYFKDKDGEVRWWANPNAISFVEFRKTQEEKKIELVKP